MGKEDEKKCRGGCANSGFLYSPTIICEQGGCISFQTSPCTLRVGNPTIHASNSVTLCGKAEFTSLWSSPCGYLTGGACAFPNHSASLSGFPDLQGGTWGPLGFPITELLKCGDQRPNKLWGGPPCTTLKGCRQIQLIWTCIVWLPRCLEVWSKSTITRVILKLPDTWSRGGPMTAKFSFHETASPSTIEKLPILNRIPPPIPCVEHIAQARLRHYIILWKERYMVSPT